MSTIDEDILSTEVQELINLVNMCVIQPLILTPGILGNIVNIHTFLRIGLRDPVTVSFFALSISDLAVLLIAYMNSLCYILYRTSNDWPVDMFGLMYLGVWYYQMVYDVSMLITTYTAVQKCCCVAMPFKFKTIFTTRTSAVVIIVSSTFCVVCYMPVLLTQDLREGLVNNRTLLVSWLSPLRPEAIAANDIIARVILQNATQVIVLACLVILFKNLINASKFRQSAILIKSSSTAKVKNESPEEKIELDETSKNNSQTNKPAVASSMKTPLSTKEVKVLKSVALVATVFVIANFPKVVLSFARQFVPEMETYRLFHNLHVTLQIMRRLVETTSASVNVFIYFKYTQRFRVTFKESVHNCRIMCGRGEL